VDARRHSPAECQWKWLPLALGVVASMTGHLMVFLSLPNLQVAGSAGGTAVKVLQVVLPSAVKQRDGNLAGISGTARAVPEMPPSEGLAVFSSETKATIRQLSLVAHEYIPSAQLDHGPRVLEPVDIRYPQFGASEDVTLLLSLFINERGELDRIEVDDPDRYPVFAATAIRAFSNVQFKPGQTLGRNVKSLMRVEVVFQPPATVEPPHQ
jgi:hypothetical protein